MSKATAINGGETLLDSEELGSKKNHDLELSLSVPVEGNLTEENPPPVFTQVDPRTLKPHPQNSAIYGESESVTELIELIRSSGWIKPLVVTTTGTIISGHQRCKAVFSYLAPWGETTNIQIYSVKV